MLEVPVICTGRRLVEEGRGVGLKFYGPSADRYRMIAKVVFSSIDPIWKGRHEAYTRQGITGGSLTMLTWWVTQTSRGLYYALFRRAGQERAAATVARPTESSVA